MDVFDLVHFIIILTNHLSHQLYKKLGLQVYQINKIMKTHFSYHLCTHNTQQYLLKEKSFKFFHLVDHFNTLLRINHHLHLYKTQVHVVFHLWNNLCKSHFHICKYRTGIGFCRILSAGWAWDMCRLFQTPPVLSPFIK